jgi:hypothetical protein
MRPIWLNILSLMQDKNGLAPILVDLFTMRLNIQWREKNNGNIYSLKVI